MPDVFTKEKRSQVMSRIRGRGNKDTEVALAKLFRLHGITGWRRNQKIFGKPDFVFQKVKLVVFVDGCFWHSCPKHRTKPKNNEMFWHRKLSGNKKRDQIVNRVLRRTGWRILRIWEHELRNGWEKLLVRRILRNLVISAAKSIL
jgi:DNA mismatch endonuclease (patch repair protein)